MAAIIITGYISNEVAEKKTKSVKETTSFLRSVIKKAKGSVRKLEVVMGSIFITLKDDTGVTELKAALAGIDEVKVEEPSQAVLIFLKNEALRKEQLSGKSEK